MDSEKLTKVVARSIIGLCLFLFFLMAWVINPNGTSDAFSSENLWEAVHPYHWLFDTIGMIGFTAFALYIAGFLGKVVYTFTEPKEENSSGLIHAVAAIGFLSIILLFV
jgi:hypothetical protein